MYNEDLLVDVVEVGGEEGGPLAIDHEDEALPLVDEAT